MTVESMIEAVHLEELLDLGWPTDRDLVDSFRKTLQQGRPFAPIQVNRVWQEDATWHYEIIDGFHRYEAAKAEHVDVLNCQVVEVDERTARYARIQACMGKPSTVTSQRALLELQRAFVTDMQTLIGNPEVLYEPIVGEDGQVQARRRTVALPEDPYEALQALADHLFATRAAYPKYWVRVVGRGQMLRTPFGRRTGWEQALNDWLAEMAERFGYRPSWLLDLLHLQLFDDFLGPRRWYARRGQPLFSEEKEYVEFALRLWQIPDVDLRAWFRRRLETEPQQRYWLAKVQDLLQLNGFPEPGQTRTGPNKQELLHLLSDVPSLYNLAVTLRKRQQETLPAPMEAGSQSEEMAQQPPLPAEARIPEPSEQRERNSAIFAVGSPTFVSRPAPPPSAERNLVPPVGAMSDQVLAYQPVHEACVVLMQAITVLSAQYGTAWLHWESAQADLIQLGALLALG